MASLLCANLLIRNSEKHSHTHGTAIGSSKGFSILPKTTSTCRLGELGIEATNLLIGRQLTLPPEPPCWFSPLFLKDAQLHQQTQWHSWYNWLHFMGILEGCYVRNYCSLWGRTEKSQAKGNVLNHGTAFSAQKHFRMAGLPPLLT